MRDEKILRERLEQLRGQLLQWGTPDLMVLHYHEGRAPGLDSGARVGAAQIGAVSVKALASVPIC